MECATAIPRLLERQGLPVVAEGVAKASTSRRLTKSARMPGMLPSAAARATSVSRGAGREDCFTSTSTLYQQG